MRNFWVNVFWKLINWLAASIADISVRKIQIATITTYPIPISYYDSPLWGFIICLKISKNIFLHLILLLLLLLVILPFILLNIHIFILLIPWLIIILILVILLSSIIVVWIWIGILTIRSQTFPSSEPSSCNAFY